MEFAVYFQFDYLAPHLVNLGIFVILAASLDLINGQAGLFSLGHAGFMGAGAYATAGLIVLGLAGTPVWAQVPAGLAFGILAGAAFGALVGVPCLRLAGDYLAIATLGFAAMFESVINVIGPLGQADGFPVGEPTWPRSFVYEYGRPQFVFFLVLTWASVAAAFALIANLMRSSHGRAVLSIREDELAGQLVGVKVTKYKVLVFVIGAALAGYAGGLFAMFNRIIAPREFGLDRTLLLLVMVVLGGLGSLRGVVIGATALYVLERVLRAISFPIAGVPVSELWLLFYALLLVVLMLARPEGIMGGRRRRKAQGRDAR